ncbi:hypothetical protein AQ801_27715 [Burkholderia pseudomallei]|nr:hypothetical protein AQ801_27715 [Burkholderia pseudomallei]
MIERQLRSRLTHVALAERDAPILLRTLETDNPERAAQRIVEAQDYLPHADVNRLVRDPEADYCEFT